MITFHQITKASDIVLLSDYYVLDMRTTGPNPAVNAITAVAMLQVEGDIIIQEADVRITPDAESNTESETGYYQIGQVAESMARLLLDQTVVSEPQTLKFLKVLLEQNGYDGELYFVPVSMLTKQLFSSVSSETDSIQDLARQLDIPERDNAGLLRTAYFEHELFRKCRIALGANPASEPVQYSEEEKQNGDAPRRQHRISNQALKQWAKSVWSVSPWVIVATAFLVGLFIIISIPRRQDESVDRNTAPVNYLVLSWDETGKYGTKPRSSRDDAAIQFRVPYGVYNVLNNNSIPVELNILTDNEENTSESDESEQNSTEDNTPAAVELSATSGRGGAQEDDEEATRQTHVTMRPNSTRQITIDTDQYLTLSENANNLILFYVSEVPEVRESDTTGQDDSNGSRIVYAYIKGTEVRFRKSPSLEGAIIDVLQNGQQVQVLGVTGEWTHVSVQNDKGYIFSQYLTSEDPQAVAFAAKKAEEETAAQAAAQEAEAAIAATAESSVPDSVMPIDLQPADTVSVSPSD